MLNILSHVEQNLSPFYFASLYEVIFSGRILLECKCPEPQSRLHAKQQDGIKETYILCCGGVLWSHGLTSWGPANKIPQLLSHSMIFPAYGKQ